MIACARPALPQAAEASSLGTSSLHQDLFQHPTRLDVTLAHLPTMAPPGLKSGHFKRQKKAGKRLTQPGPSVDLSPPTPAASTRLPDEIFSQIAQHVLGAEFWELDVAALSLDSRKPAFACIDGMTRASRRLRAIALSEWFRLFLVRHPSDWMWASHLGSMRTWVRHIACPPYALEAPVPSHILATFPYLRSASLSLSCDYEFNPFQPSNNIFPSAPAELEIVPGFTYRQPVTVFPSTMTSLAVRSAHGSETPLLRQLGLHCPDLRSLQLGKCTMFDCCTNGDATRSGDCGGSAESSDAYYGQIADGTQCPFWGAFPFDHDIYFGSEGVEAYAEELASELLPLQNLEEISLGVYLTPHAALAEHRLAHYPWRHLENSQMATDTEMTPPFPDAPPTAPTPDFPTPSSTIPPTFTPPALAFPFSTSQMPPPPYANPALWSYDCSACRKIYSAPTLVAELTAGLILARMLPKLRKIEWASFFESRPETPDGRESCGFRRGTGTHEWRVVRDEAGMILNLEQVL